MREEKNFNSKLVEIKAWMSASNMHSPLFSDKASCPEDEEKELNVDSIDNKVAFGMVFLNGDMSKSVHGVPLQLEYVRVSLDGAIKEDALVLVPILGEIETVRQVVGSLLAWPEDMVILTSGVEKKKKVPKTNVSTNQYHQVHLSMNSMKPSRNMFLHFMLFYKHAATILKETGDSIQIPCDAEVFGNEKTIFLLHENVMALLEFGMVGQAVISAYMAVLHVGILKANKMDLYVSIDPGATYKLNDDFEAYIVTRLKEGPSRLFFMPHNENYHWILIIIWESEIFILNPLSHPRSFPELEDALIRAVRLYNAQTGRVCKNGKVKKLVGSPKQPGGHECGYIVMRYMKYIFQDKDMKLITRWATKNRKTYTAEELDEDRFEILQHVQEFV
ncbi:uncharacterized protein LOC141690763 [Apium graveolens]|uniref:uncharacterized protein LOC141690763 n=1 Tax=Apium graveolens TaxID=4045 RepID=UPI003D7BC55D